MSLKTSNSRKNEKTNAAKFPMNSNFLNLLKKKNIENVKQQNNSNSKNQSIGPEFVPERH